MIRSGDRVTVTVRGHRAPATVTSPYTALGNVEVELDEPIDDLGAGTLPVRRVVRSPADLEVLRPDPTRATYSSEPWTRTETTIAALIFIAFCVLILAMAW